MELKKQLLKEKLYGWTDRIAFDFNPDFVDIVYEIRSGMHENIQVKPIDLLTYKKAILYDIARDVEGIDEIKITDEELFENRFRNGEHRGRKVTKVLTEKVREKGGYGNDQRLDFFHKLRNENEEYLITADPYEFVNAFLEIQTCYSPGGENQSNVLKYLVSPYVYIALNKKRTARMLIFADFENKVVFFHGVYGIYDYMFPLAIVKYFVDEGFEFCYDSTDYFHEEDFMQYVDRYETAYEGHINFFDGDYTSSGEGVIMWGRPKWATYEGDAFVSYLKDARDTLHYTTVLPIKDSCFGEWILLPDTQYCSECSRVVDEREYDGDYEMCEECKGAREWCSNCEDFVDAEYFNFETGMCQHCTERFMDWCDICEEYVEHNYYNRQRKMCDFCVEDRLIKCRFCGKFADRDDYHIEKDMCFECFESIEKQKMVIRLKDFFKIIDENQRLSIQDYDTHAFYDYENIGEKEMDFFVFEVRPLKWGGGGLESEELEVLIADRE